MLKPKLPLQAFSAAIAQSVSKANEMLQIHHKVALQRYRNDQLGTVMLPPPPLMIHNVRVKFKGNVSKNDNDGELFIDLSRPDGNFGAEMEFAPFSVEMLKAVKHDGGRNVPLAAKPAAPVTTPPPQHQPQTEPKGSFRPQEPQPYPVELNSEGPDGEYDSSDTPRDYSSEF